MRGTLRLSIGGKGEQPLVMEYDLLVEPVPGGMRLFDRDTGQYAVLYDVELRNVAQTGDGATPATALMVSHLIDQKFGFDN